MQSAFPLGPDQPLVVPVELSSDLDREGPIAASLAEPFGAPLEVVTILGTEDFLPAEFLLFAEQVDKIATDHEPGVTLRVAVADRVAAAFFAACSGHVICMTTSASPFKRQHHVGSFAAALMARTTFPAFLIGPSVPAGRRSYDRVVAAVTDEVESRRVLPVARELAGVLEVPMQRLSLAEDTGTVYTTSFGDDPDCLPTSIRASMRTDIVEPEVVGDTIARRGANEIVAVATDARQGLAWVAEPSVAFDIVGASDSPVVAIGPRFGRPPEPAGQLEGETIELAGLWADDAFEELERRYSAGTDGLGQVVYRPS